MSTLMDMPAVAECSVAGCSYNDHSHCHAAAVNIGGAHGRRAVHHVLPARHQGRPRQGDHARRRLPARRVRAQLVARVHRGVDPRRRGPRGGGLPHVQRRADPRHDDGRPGSIRGGLRRARARLRRCAATSTRSRTSTAAAGTSPARRGPATDRRRARAAASSSAASGSTSVACRNAASSARAACEYTPPASTATSAMISAVSETSSSAVPVRAFDQSTSAGPWLSVRITFAGCRSRWTIDRAGRDQRPDVGLARVPSPRARGSRAAGCAGRAGSPAASGSETSPAPSACSRVGPCRRSITRSGPLACEDGGGGEAVRDDVPQQVDLRGRVAAGAVAAQDRVVVEREHVGGRTGGEDGPGRRRRPGPRRRRGGGWSTGIVDRRSGMGRRSGGWSQRPQRPSF